VTGPTGQLNEGMRHAQYGPYADTKEQFLPRYAVLRARICSGLIPFVRRLWSVHNLWTRGSSH
jgi:hypothetical protein